VKPRPRSEESPLPPPSKPAQPHPGGAEASAEAEPTKGRPTTNIGKTLSSFQSVIEKNWIFFSLAVLFPGLCVSFIFIFIRSLHVQKIHKLTGYVKE
jgi:hypothetical protein